jgi:hypothetical protein
MPRRAKAKLNEGNSEIKILTEVYNDNFTVKNLSLNILKNVAKNINYDDKEEVLKTLPFVQKQMDIINHTNGVIITIQNKLNELNESESESES